MLQISTFFIWYRFWHSVDNYCTMNFLMKTYIKLKREGLLLSMIIFFSTAGVLLYEFIRFLLS